MLNQYLQSNIRQRNDFRFIHCPEIVTPYCGQEFEDELLNQQLERIRGVRQKMLSIGNFEGYVFRTARPYRFDALLEIIASSRMNFEQLA